MEVALNRKANQFDIKILALLAFVVPNIVVAESPDLSGSYTMAGKSDLSQSEYSGTCELSQIDDHYEVECLSSGDQYQGRGMLTDGVFSLYLGQFLVVYQVAKDGSLAGRWVHSGNGEMGRETLTPT